MVISNMHKNFVKFGCAVLSYARVQTYKQTTRQTHHNTVHLQQGKVTMS